MNNLLHILLLSILMLLFSGCSNSGSGHIENHKSEQSERNASALKAVKRNPRAFKKQKILGFEEGKVWIALRNNINFREFTVLPQVSLGEIIYVDKKNIDRNEFSPLFMSYNCKRVDFCIMDKHFIPILVVEYNGDGHYLDDWKTRDEIKDEVCKSAGIPLIVISSAKEINKKIEDEILPTLERYSQKFASAAS